MHARPPRPLRLLAVAVASAVGLGALSGCGGDKEAAAAAQERAQRARKVAAAWDGSKAAAAWRAGYHPMADVTRPPRGGLHGSTDERAYENRDFTLRGALPTTGPEEGRVTWAGGGSLTRPLVTADEAFESLARTAVGGKQHLTVTGAKLGEMTLATSRGPATVPAWLFTLDGYDAPLRRAAAVPSELPEPPIGRARDVPGQPLRHLVGLSTGGRAVTVVALHGACDDGPVVDVLETRDSVVLSASVKKRKSSGYCTKQGKLQQMTVKLGRPVGDRVLLDAITGRPLPYKPPNGPTSSRR